MKPFDQPVYVTRPYLPPLDKFAEGLKEIWNGGWLSNSGPVLHRFRDKLSCVLQTDNLSLFANGSLALQLGLQALDLKGEVITTPFTYVASTHAIALNGLVPVFADIEPCRYTLDPARVEALITERTRAILAVHVFGFPCDVEALAALADRHGLVLIYDAAHAFGVEINNRSIAGFGDLSVFSFHATKPFHSAEGGAATFADPVLKETLAQLSNNGYESDTRVAQVGTNAKLNELQALMGEQVLAYLDEITLARERLEAVYRRRLSEVPGINLCPVLPEDVKANFIFMPVQIDDDTFAMTRDQLWEWLKQHNVFAKRYFFPVVADLACYRHLTARDPLRIARQVAGNILVLPLYAGLAEDDVHRICDIIIQAGRGTRTA